MLLGANYSFNSGFYGGADNTYGQGAYFLLNANVTWELASGVDIKLWGKNLTNKAYSTFLAFQNNPGGFADRILAPPRTFGITLSYSR